MSNVVTYVAVHVVSVLVCAAAAQREWESLSRLTSDGSAAEDSLVLSSTPQPSANGDTASVLSSVDMV